MWLVPQVQGAVETRTQVCLGSICSHVCDRFKGQDLSVHIVSGLVQGMEDDLDGDMHDVDSSNGGMIRSRPTKRRLISEI